MKKFSTILMMAVFCISLSSCYTLTYDVGRGAQTGVASTAKNHYLIGGLVPLGASNPTQMAAGASDYTVKIEHSFIDGLVNAITLGIYTPTTTTVTK